MTEWRDVVGYEGLYRVSSDGEIEHLKRNILLSQSTTALGYSVVTLFKNGSKLMVRVHRLVAQAFIPNPDDKPQVNHKDGKKQNNRVDNLEWNTQLENNRHARQTGLNPPLRGERNGSSKLTSTEVESIKELLKVGELPQHKIGRLFGVSQGTVSLINSGMLWSHI